MTTRSDIFTDIEIVSVLCFNGPCSLWIFWVAIFNCLGGRGVVIEPPSSLRVADVPRKNLEKHKTASPSKSTKERKKQIQKGPHTQRQLWARGLDICVAAACREPSNSRPLERH